VPECRAAERHLRAADRLPQVVRAAVPAAAVPVAVVPAVAVPAAAVPVAAVPVAVVVRAVADPAAVRAVVRVEVVVCHLHPCLHLVVEVLAGPAGPLAVRAARVAKTD